MLQKEGRGEGQGWSPEEHQNHKGAEQSLWKSISLSYNIPVALSQLSVCSHSSSRTDRCAPPGSPAAADGR